MKAGTLIKGRWVLPITAPPLEFGAVELLGDRIQAVLNCEQAQARLASAGDELTVQEFADALIMPGLINLHTHLEWTAVEIAEAQLPLFDWIEKLVGASCSWTAESFLSSANAGVQRLINSGTSCVMDSAYTGKAALALSTAGMRAVVALELFGLDDSKVEEALQAWHLKRASVLETGAVSPLVKLSIAPHAPYSVSVPLAQRAARLADELALPYTMHVSESANELAWFASGDSRLDAFIEKMHRLPAHKVPVRACGKTPVEHLADNRLLTSSLVAAHAVQVTDSDVRALAKARAKVASCPRSNRRLLNGTAPLRRLMESGVTVGFGTDSLAANDDLDVLAEARFAYNLQQAVDPAFPFEAEWAIRQLTIEAAQALGLGKEIGSLERGKQADIAIFNIDNPLGIFGKQPYEALLYGRPALQALLVDGIKVGPKSLY